MKEGRLRKVVVAALVVASIAGLSTAVATARTHSSSKSSVKVGIIYSRTGLLSAYGAEYIEGLNLGLRYATNGTNTVNGHKHRADAGRRQDRCRHRRSRRRRT